MHFAREDYTSEYLIRAYAAGVITVGERRYHRSLLLTDQTPVTDWRPQHIDDLRHDDFEPVLALAPDILLLGTGSVLIFPTPSLTARLLQAGIGVEVMDTAAACRTFNILLAEQRRVVAALLLD